MLSELRIQGLGVIDDAVLELHPGLNVVTGETGAGKTMVVTGLGLLLGARADAGLVRAGAGSAVVEGVRRRRRATTRRPLRAAEAGAEVDDGLRARALGRRAEGRSRAHVGGRTAPVGVLGEIGEHLVAVHGQADQWRLRQSDQHRAVLDQFGGAPLHKALPALHRRLRRPPGRGRRAGRACASRPATGPARSRCSSTGWRSSSRSTPSPARTPTCGSRTSGSATPRGCAAPRPWPTTTSPAREEYAAEPAPSAVELLAAARQALAR